MGRKSKGGIIISSAYKAVRSSREISRDIQDLLEQLDPKRFNGINRAGNIRAFNNILQGNSEKTAETFLAELQEKADGRASEKVQTIAQSVTEFQTQKSLLAQPYTKASDKAYQFEIRDFAFSGSRKIINQRLFNRAARSGFPPDFFRGSCFERVTFFCLPDGADFIGSRFKGCTFAVCRIVGANFKDAVFHDSEFHSCKVEETSFEWANIVHTRFRDCSIQSVSFQKAMLKSCSTTDCVMGTVDFQEAVLDGSTYGGITASGIVNLSSAEISQGGATAEEVRHLAVSTFRELGVPMFPVRQSPIRKSTAKKNQIPR